MKTIIRQDTLTGCFNVVEGEVITKDAFYNGRYFGLNSNDWVNKKPVVTKSVRPSLKSITVGYVNGLYGYQLEEIK